MGQYRVPVSPGSGQTLMLMLLYKSTTEYVGQLHAYHSSQSHFILWAFNYFIDSLGLDNCLNFPVNTLVLDFPHQISVSNNFFFFHTQPNFFFFFWLSILWMPHTVLNYMLILEYADYLSRREILESYEINFPTPEFLGTSFQFSRGISWWRCVVQVSPHLQRAAPPLRHTFPPASVIFLLNFSTPK